MSEGWQAAIAALPPALLGGGGGFRSDARFAAHTDTLPAEPEPPEPEPDIEPEDPLASAWAEGHAAGAEHARAEAEVRATEDAAAREGLALSLQRLDAQLAEELRLRLRDTVVALCESAILPLALDQTKLMERIERAVAMLSRADDDRTIRLNPEDLAFLDPQMPAQWRVVADPALERGSLRIETPGGGVEDGPEQWRRAIAEALHQC